MLSRSRAQACCLPTVRVPSITSGLILPGWLTEPVTSIEVNWRALALLLIFSVLIVVLFVFRVVILARHGDTPRARLVGTASSLAALCSCLVLFGMVLAFWQEWGWATFAFVAGAIMLVPTIRAVRALR